MMRKCNYAGCGRSYQAKRPQSKFCSPNCRVKNSRIPHVPVVPSRRKTGGSPASSITPDAPPPSDSPDNSLVKATKTELEAAGVADTMMGQQALRIAMQMSGFETAGGMASLSKELSRVMAEALRVGMASVADSVDELKARREAKRAV